MKEVREIKHQQHVDEISRKKTKSSEELWNLRYAELLRFKKEYHHCCVPKSHQMPGSESPYKKLSRWVRGQRQNYAFLKDGKPNCLTPERMHLLDSVGFKWNMATIPTVSWANRLEQLKQYKEMHGHTNVPHLQKDPPGLGNWVAIQRKENSYRIGRRKVPMSCRGIGLNERRMKDLNAIGFEWSLRNRSCFRKASIEKKLLEAEYEHGQDKNNTMKEAIPEIEESAEASEEDLEEQPPELERQDATTIALKKMPLPKTKLLESEYEHGDGNNMIKEIEFKIDVAAEANEDDFEEPPPEQEQHHPHQHANEEDDFVHQQDATSIALNAMPTSKQLHLRQKRDYEENAFIQQEQQYAPSNILNLSSHSRMSKTNAAVADEIKVLQFGAGNVNNSLNTII